MRGVHAAAADGFFVGFITSNFVPVTWHLIFLGCTAGIILMGVQKGVERASVIMMPILLVLAFIIAVYSMTRPGAGAGIGEATARIFARENIEGIAIVDYNYEAACKTAEGVGIIMSESSSAALDSPLA